MPCKATAVSEEDAVLVNVEPWIYGGGESDMK